MQRRNPRKFVEDALDSASFVIQFAAEGDVERYRSDRPFRSAIERELIIVGEALAQLRRLDPQVASHIPDLPQAVDFRNVTVHGYGLLSAEIVWSTVQDDLPNLVTQLQNVLADLES
ncbi:MAG: DUF86 domain-containing protein [Phycisphaeraceae bacterium]